MKKIFYCIAIIFLATVSADSKADTKESTTRAKKIVLFKGLPTEINNCQVTYNGFDTRGNLIITEGNTRRTLPKNLKNTILAEQKVFLLFTSKNKMEVTIKNLDYGFIPNPPGI